MATDWQRRLDAGPLAAEVVQLAALQAELAIRLQYEPAEDQTELTLRVVDAALSVVDEAGCFARYVLQMAESEMLPACRARRRGREL
jgi:hypothetical protein